MSFPNEQDAAFEAYGRFHPLSPGELHQIRAKAAEAIRDKGEVWWNPSRTAREHGR